MIMSKDGNIKVKLVASGTEVEIVPGIKSVLIPREAVPRYGIAQLMRQPDGS
jgi:hypothetical protein